MTYTLIYKKRKSLAIVITKNGQIEVRAPFRTPKYTVENFLNLKQAWITKTILKQQNQQEKVDQKSEYFLFNNPDLTQVFNQNLKQISNEHLFDYIQKQVRVFQTEMKLEKVNIQLQCKKYKTKWGSCSYKKLLGIRAFLPKNVILKFNSWLAVFDPKIIDYVIIHELAHIYQNNHSPKFWKVVENFYPDYKLARKNLTEVGRVLLR